MNWPYLSPGYTIHPEVVENMPSLTLLEIMIHEPMHDWERFGWDIGHNDASGLDEQIGWSIRGWPLGVQQVLIWVYNILVRMPPTGPKTGGMNNRWDECLREAGLQ